jgi:hypothetical protein
MRATDRREIVFVLLWSALVVALTGIPYFLAHQWAGPDRHFAGFLWGPDEGNVYLAWIRQASEGQTVLANQYTTRVQQPHFLNAFFLALGALCRYLRLQPLEAFHLARLIGIPVALLAFYRLLAYFTAVRLARLGGVVLVSIGSGFGWIFTLRAYAGMRPDFTPMDCASGWQVMPEAVTFLSFLLNPLFTWSLALLAVTLLWAFRSFEKGSFGGITIAGLLLLLLGNVHTYDAFAVYAATFLWMVFLLRRGDLRLGRALALYAIFFVLSVPSLLWARHASAADPAYLAKIMTPTLSPGLLDYALGYGLLALAAFLGLLSAWLLRSRHPRPMAAVFWVVVTFALVYAPVSFQRKMIEGAHMALACLAAFGLAFALPALAERRWPVTMTANARWSRRRAVALKALVLVCLLSVPSNVVFIYDSLLHVSANNADLLSVLMPPAYLTTDEIAGMDWLAAHTTLEDIVLSSSFIGSHIPAFCRARVVAGHWAETLNFPAMVRMVSTFYAPGLTPGIRADILESTGATYVWWGQYEQLVQRSMVRIAEHAVGGPVALPDPPNRGQRSLRAVFRRGDVVIYRVLRVQPSASPQER